MAYRRSYELLSNDLRAREHVCFLRDETFHAVASCMPFKQRILQYFRHRQLSCSFLFTLIELPGSMSILHSSPYLMPPTLSMRSIPIGAKPNLRWTQTYCYQHNLIDKLPCTVGVPYPATGALLTACSPSRCSLSCNSQNNHLLLSTAHQALR